MLAVATFYRFTPVSDPAALRATLQAAARPLGLTGTLLLAPEGVNGTLAGARAALERFRRELTRHAGFAGLTFRYSAAAPDAPVFRRLKVRVKREIVTFGQPAANPSAAAGERVDAARWNGLLDDPEVLVVDTRNRYEVALGTFPGAVNPDTGSFREFARFAELHLDPLRHPRVALYCTGGIRCEKASAHLLNAGYREVYQLGGGILEYLDTVPEEHNRWRGECFVFDERVSVDRNLEEGTHRGAHIGLRRPLSCRATDEA